MKKSLGLIVLVLLLAYALRLFALADKAVWWDEAWSAWVAQQDFARTTELTARDVHPPLYQWVLHMWVRLAGISEFSIRYLSLLWSVLTVALIGALAQRIAGKRAALWALVFAASAAFLIHWAQETRMYAQASFFCALAAYALIRLLNGGGRGWWITLALAGAALSLTHYLGVFGAAILGLYALLNTRTRPQALRWFSALAVSGIIFGAWVIYALPLTRSGSAGGEFDAGLVFQLSATLLAAGASINLERYNLPALIFALVFFIGLALYTRKHGRAALIVWLFVMLPPLAIYTLGVLQTRFYSPKPEERYLIIFAPVVYAGLGAALDALWRRQRGLGAVAVVALAVMYGAAFARDLDARYYRDDYDTLFKVVNSLAQPDEPILFVSEDRYPLVLYHLNRAAGWQSPFEILGVPPFEAGGTDNLTRLLNGRTRFWYVEIERHFQDPTGGYRQYLDANFRRMFHADIDYNGVTLYEGAVAVRPLSDGVLLPPISEARPGDVVRAGASGAIAWAYGNMVLEGQDSATWNLSQFTVYPAYPDGVYQVVAGGLRKSFVVRGAQSIDPRTVPLNARVNFGSMTLLGYSVADSSVAAGESFEITLYWRVDEPMDTNYTVFAQLIGPFRDDGPVWASADRYPAQTPTTKLWPDMIFADTYTLAVPPDMPPGTHAALFGLYNLETGRRLNTEDGGDAVTVRDLVVTEGANNP